MTSDAVIRVRNLSKQYRLGQREPYGALRDVLANTASASWRRLRAAGHAGAQEASPDYMWALSDISFDVGQGEVVGLIGRNGAGKSTLLKILSRVTSPTHGQAGLRGRVGALLEVGTGFHPELSGRENIYLNGAVLGMRRTEIARKFDEIVAFAEVERFLDTPVKRYSSGMYLRLAFAIAAHLEPEILLVDEVLAVGDAAFQKKCLGKMDDVAHEGRTILFVSHNMSAIQRLCHRVLFLDGGRLVADGATAETVRHYLASSIAGAAPNTTVEVSHVSRKGNGAVRALQVRYGGDDPRLGFHPYPMGPLDVELLVETEAPRAVGSVAISLYDLSGTRLVNADTIAQGTTVQLAAGQNRLRLRIAELYLNPGAYHLGWWLADPLGRPFEYVDAGMQIEVVEPVQSGFGVRPKADGLVPCTFELCCVEPVFPPPELETIE